MDFISPEEALKLFIQANWLGPAPSLPAAFVDMDTAKRDQSMTGLVVDGEYPYRLVKNPLLLKVALTAEEPWTRLRALFTQQRILDEQSFTLKSEIYKIIDGHMLPAGALYGPSVYTEVALIYQFYHDEAKAEEALKLSSETIGLKYELTGVLGRRSRFQTFETTQLTVQVKGGDSTAGTTGSIPKDLPLNDDTLLEKTALSEGIGGDLGHDALAILLAQAGHLLTFYAKDGVVMEKALAYVGKVLEKPSVWSIYSTGLYLRSRLESTVSRKIERATLQIQALVNQIDAAEPVIEERYTMFFATGMPSPWEMDATQGYLSASLGAFKTALAIFNRRELWDEAISCLMQLGDSQGAEERIMSEMAVMPENPKLWCLLGDLKDDVSCYEKAWEFSGAKYSRAQRSIGKYWFKKQEWAKALEAFDLALTINPLFVKTWFVLGCACIQLGQTRKAIQAFTRVVALEPDNAEAWNNIALIHTEEDRSKDALAAFKEAARLDYANWKIQANYFQTALVCGELQVACNALCRVAELRGKEFDLRDLQRLVDLLEKGVQFVGLQEYEMVNVRKRITLLIEEVLSEHFAGASDLWVCLAKVEQIYKCPAEEKRILFKAYRAAKALPFAKDITLLGKLVDILTDLSNLIISGGTSEERFQIEMMAKGVRSAVANIFSEVEKPMVELAQLCTKLNIQ